MKDTYRILKIAAAIVAFGSAVWFAFEHTQMFCLIVAFGVVLACIVRKFHRAHCTRRFCEERAAAMNAVEGLSKLIAYYDAELPLRPHQRATFQLAVANSEKLGSAMKTWIYAMQERFQNDCLPAEGLQLKDVPALIDAVRDEIIEAHNVIRGGVQGIPRAAILLDSWYDEFSVFGLSAHIMHAPSGPGMPGKERRARRDRAFPKPRAKVIDIETGRRKLAVVR